VRVKVATLDFQSTCDNAGKTVHELLPYYNVHLKVSRIVIVMFVHSDYKYDISGTTEMQAFTST